MITKMTAARRSRLIRCRDLRRPRTDRTAATRSHRDLHRDDRGHRWSAEPAKPMTKGTVAQRFDSVDDYISTFPPEVQTVLQAVRQTIHAAAPGAKESISYQIPTFTHRWAASRLSSRLEEAHQHLPSAGPRREARAADCSLSLRKRHRQVRAWVSRSHTS